MRTAGSDGEFRRRVAAREARKLKARREGRRSAVSGLGLFGVVGWSVVVPTLLGIALGWWIDRAWPSPYSFTLMFLFAGLVLGCANAWHWIDRESRDD